MVEEEVIVAVPVTVAVVVEEMVDAEEVALEYWVVTWVVVVRVELEEIGRLDVCEVCMEDDWVLVLDVWLKVAVLEFEVIPGAGRPLPGRGPGRLRQTPSRPQRSAS